MWLCPKEQGIQTLMNFQKREEGHEEADRLKEPSAEHQARQNSPRTDPLKRSFGEAGLGEAQEEEVVSVEVLRMCPEEDANPQEAQTVHLCPQMLLTDWELHPSHRNELPLTLLENHRYSQARSAH